MYERRVMMYVTLSRMLATIGTFSRRKKPLEHKENYRCFYFTRIFHIFRANCTNTV